VASGPRPGSTLRQRQFAGIDDSTSSRRCWRAGVLAACRLEARGEKTEVAAGLVIAPLQVPAGARPSSVQGLTPPKSDAE